MEDDFVMDDYMEDSLSRPSLRSPSNLSGPATINPAAISTPLNGNTDPNLALNFTTAQESSLIPSSITANTNMDAGENIIGKVDDLNISPELPKHEDDIIPDEIENASAAMRPSKAAVMAAKNRKTLCRSLLPSGLCYDARMRFHASEDRMDYEAHPEDPRRIEAIYNELCASGLVALPGENPSDGRFLRRIEAREATMEEICTIHTIDHYNWVESLESRYSHFS